MPIKLTKAGLIERAAAWAQDRGVKFTATRLNEWMKQALVLGGLRDANEGKKAVYWYGCRHYRRILQITRLYARGVRDRDAILLQLFLKGYSVGPHQIRSSLKKEFISLRRKINSQLRSTRFDAQRAIPPKHKASMIRSGGEPDKRFTAAGIAPGPDLMLAVARAARSPDPQSALRKADFKYPETTQRDALLQTLGGWLVDDPDFPSEVEGLIDRASDQQYELARVCGQFIYRLWSPGMSAKTETNQKGAIDAFLSSYETREFACLHIIMGLQFAVGLENIMDNQDRAV